MHCTDHELHPSVVGLAVFMRFFIWFSKVISHCSSTLWIVLSSCNFREIYNAHNISNLCIKHEKMNMHLTPTMTMYDTAYITEFVESKTMIS